jgi:hypothetical protein
MKIEFEITKATTKRLLILGVVLSGALTVAVVHAVPVSFNSGDLLTAAQLNQNFGDLETRLHAIEATVHPASAFQARLTVAQSIPTALMTNVIFDQVQFDSANEYNKTTGAFRVAQAGVYSLSCVVELGPLPATVVNSYGAIRVNGTDLTGYDIYSTSTYLSLPLSVVTKLAAGDTVTCAVVQISGATVNVYVGTGVARNSFSGARLY